jgi:hypothetical protein
MNSRDIAHLVDFQVCEFGRPQETRVVDQNVQPAKIGDRAFHKRGTTIRRRNVVVGCRSITACGADLLYYLLSPRTVGTPIICNVVNNHGAAPAGEFEGIGFTQATPGTRDDGRLTRE